MEKAARLISAWTMVFFFLATSALAQTPILISPGANDDTDIVISGSPAFSWSEVADADSYQVAVFASDELSAPLSYEEISLLKTPVIEHTVPGRGFSWTPSANAGLCAGTYVWYVAAVDIEDATEWSKGKMFRVDALAGLNAVANKCAVSVSQIVSGEDVDQEPEKPVVTEGDGNGSLNLEQAIFLWVPREQLPQSDGNGQESGASPTKAPVTMGVEGSSNTFYGFQAGGSATKGIDATFIGASAGYHNTDDGIQNTFIGAYAGMYNVDADYNTFVGRNAGRNNDGEANTFIGTDAGYFNDTGKGNTFVGESAGLSNISGPDNTFVGNAAGSKNKKGDSNTFIGRYAGKENTDGTDNVFIGVDTGWKNFTGSRNTFIGAYAGASNETGHNNVFIGYNTRSGQVSESSKLYIDSSTSSFPLIYGEFDNRIVKINGELQMIGSAASSDIRLKKDIQPLDASLDKVLALQGMSYHWKTEQYPDLGFKDTKQIGLVAQEVEAVIPELVSTDSQGYKAVSYDKLTAVLVEAVKELKTEVDAVKELRAENERLKTELSELRALIKEL